jgi:short-subunit dehydrogenase
MTNFKEKIMDIKDKVAIVTGASSGIGKATARLFSEKGAKVVLASRSEDKLQKLAVKLPGSIAVPVDMTKAESIKNMIDRTMEHFGRIDILINNAGQGMSAPVEKINIEDYRRLIELNVIGPLAAMEIVVPIMRAQGGGAIVNVSSMVSKMYIPGIAAYASTKYALNALSLTARAELEKENIVVGVVHPYITNTDFFKNIIGENGGRESAKADNEVDEGMPPADPPEKVAEKILEAVESGKAEVPLRKFIPENHNNDTPADS